MTNKICGYSALFLAALVLVATGFTGFASAYTYSGGSGTESDPYQISTELDLYNLTLSDTDWNKGYYFILESDLYLTNISSIVANPEEKTITICSSTSGVAPQVYDWSADTFNQPDWHPGYNASLGLSSSVAWNSIGNSSINFKGTFNGNNKTIYGLFINASSGYQGLFGCTKPFQTFNLKNLRLENSFIYSNICSGGGYVGSMVGHVGQDSTCAILNCSASNCAIVATGDGSYVGGLIGSASDYGSDRTTTISECRVMNCTVIASSTRVGGMVGTFSGDTVKYCNVSNCIVFGTSSSSSALSSSAVGGLFGQVDSSVTYCNITNCDVIGDYWVSAAIGLLSSTDINNISVSHCNIHSYGSRATGGLVGSADVPTVKDCRVTYCNITASGYGAGGLIGYTAKSSSSTSDNCRLLDNSVLHCDINGNYDVGGLVGYAGGAPFIAKQCIVSDTSISGNYDVSGLVGYASYTIPLVSIEYCKVTDCVRISGSYYVGGLIGYIPLDKQLILNYSTVMNSFITCAAPLDSSKSAGGLVGVSNKASNSELTNNLIENVQINVTTGDALYAYLFDVSTYPIHASNGVANLTEIALSNNNTIKNSCVLKNGNENPVLDGFRVLHQEFTLNVSNPHVTSIGEFGLCESYLTNITGIDSVERIESWAFYNCTRLDGGFYVPGTVFIASDAFEQAEGLQVIYGNTTDFVRGSETAAWVNITETGAIDIPAGSFTVENQVFLPVMLGVTDVKKFKNLTSGVYLNPDDSWERGNIYLASLYLVSNSTVNGTVIANRTTAANGDIIHLYAINSTVGYHFDGWNVTNSTDKTLVSVVDRNFTMPASNVNAGANFTANVTIVRFDNGTATEDKPNTFGSATVKPIDPVKDGHTFNGWNVSLNPGWCDFDDDAYNKSGIWNYTGDHLSDLTVVANWSINIYSVNYTMNGHGTQVTNTTATYGSTITEPAAPTETGYTFNGWYSDSGLTTPYVFSTLVTANIDMYANWSVNTYSVNYTMNGHSTQVTNTTATYGSTITEPAVPTETGYTFNGWYSDSGLTTPYVFSTPVTANVDLYANWTENPQQYTPSSSHQTGYTVIFSGPAESPRNQTVVETRIVVTVRMNDAVLPNASVTFDGVPVGRTDENGIFNTTGDAGKTLVISASLDDYTGKPVLCTVEPDIINEVEVEMADKAQSPTSRSPAPFIGILAGLGAAALVLRLRK